MKQRILAIVVAVVLVAVAIVVRGKLHPGSSKGANRHGSGKAPTVACTADLQAICDALAADGAIVADQPSVDLADIEADPTTISRLDGWITWDPAPAIAAFDAAPGQADLWSPSIELGTGNLFVAYAVGALSPSCARMWTCIAGQASRATNGIALGVGDGQTAESLTRFYPVAAALAHGDFLAMDDGLIKAIVAGPSNGQQGATLTNLVVARGSSDAVVGIEAQVRKAQGDGTNRGTQQAIAEPRPLATASVVLAPRSGADLSGVESALRGSAEKHAIAALGLAPGGKLAPASRAGELYQVRKKAG